MRAEFSISIHRGPNITIVELVGELDVATAAELQHALEDVHGPVVFECSELTFIDGHGVGVLARRAQTNGGISIRNPVDIVRRVLDICDMSEWIDHSHDDR